MSKAEVNRITISSIEVNTLLYEIPGIWSNEKLIDLHDRLLKLNLKINAGLSSPVYNKSNEPKSYNDILLQAEQTNPTPQMNSMRIEPTEQDWKNVDSDWAEFEKQFQSSKSPEEIEADRKAVLEASQIKS